MNKNQKPQKNEHADRIQSGVQWIGTMVRDVKFGTIRGILIRDGLIVETHTPRITRTGKPRGRTTPGPLASEANLIEALSDLAHDIKSCSAEGELEIKIAHGTILSWDVEHSGRSTAQSTK